MIELKKTQIQKNTGFYPRVKKEKGKQQKTYPFNYFVRGMEGHFFFIAGGIILFKI
jgi:hypothetical protein